MPEESKREHGMGSQLSIRVLLIDDHPALRVGLRVLLDREPDIRVVGESADGVEALLLSEGLAPDVIVLDCQLPSTDGVAVAARLREQGDALHGDIGES